MTNPNDPAFPRSRPEGMINPNDPDALYWERCAKGLSKREFFAAMALNGLLTNTKWARECKATQCAIEAVEAADALLAELSK